MKIYHKDNSKSNEYSFDNNEYGSNSFSKSKNTIKQHKMFNEIAKRDILSNPIDLHSNIILQNSAQRSSSVSKLNSSYNGYIERQKSPQKSESQQNLSFDGPMQVASEFGMPLRRDISSKYKSVRDLARQKDKVNPAYISFDSSSNKFNPYSSYDKMDDDSNYGRSLTKSDIVGASPKKWKHRPK